MATCRAATTDGTHSSCRQAPNTRCGSCSQAQLHAKPAATEVKVTSIFGRVQSNPAMPDKTAPCVACSASLGCTWKMDLAASAGLGSSAFGPRACITEAIGVLAPKGCAAPHRCYGLAMHNRPTRPLLLGLEPQLPPLVLHQHPSESDPCTSASACLGSAASWVLEYPCVHACPCWAGVCPQQMRTDGLGLGAAAGLLGVLVKDCRHSLDQALGSCCPG